MNTANGSIRNIAGDKRSVGIMLAPHEFAWAAKGGGKQLI
jgi:hypothetical protein